MKTPKYYMDPVKSVSQFYFKKSQASDAVKVSCKNIRPYGKRLGKNTFSLNEKTTTTSIFTVHIYFSWHKLD